MTETKLTGAQLSFDGGALVLEFRKKGGHFAFTDDELEPLREYDEDGVWDGYLLKLPNSELEAIRDFLNKWLGAWQPIETAPKDGRMFLAFRRGNNSRMPSHLLAADWIGIARYEPNFPKGPPFIEYENPMARSMVGRDGPTHWMPLPEAPK